MLRNNKSKCFWHKYDTRQHLDEFLQKNHVHEAAKILNIILCGNIHGGIQNADV